MIDHTDKRVSSVYEVYPLQVLLFYRALYAYSDRHCAVFLCSDSVINGNKLVMQSLLHPCLGTECSCL